VDISHGKKRRWKHVTVMGPLGQIQ
jgi:hypothetical protein